MKTKNKKAISIICVILLILPTITFGGNDKNKRAQSNNSCLEVSGKVSLLNTKKPGEVILVLLYKDNTVIDSITIPATHSFKFILQRNEEYAIKVIQKGFVPRLVSISTQMPEKVNNPSIFKFHFDLIPVLYTDIISANADLLDFPVALITYDEEKGYFDYREKYTDFIKAEISLNEKTD